MAHWNLAPLVTKRQPQQQHMKLRSEAKNGGNEKAKAPCTGPTPRHASMNISTNAVQRTGIQNISLTKFGAHAHTKANSSEEPSRTTNGTRRNIPALTAVVLSGRWQPPPLCHWRPAQRAHHRPDSPTSHAYDENETWFWSAVSCCAIQQAPPVRRSRHFRHAVTTSAWTASTSPWLTSTGTEFRI